MIPDRPRPGRPVAAEAAGADPSRGEEARAAAKRAADHLKAAVAAVEEALGPGAAARHPEIVAAVVQASALEHAVAAGAKASRETNRTLLQLKPRLFG